MTRPGIEPRSPGPLANTLTTRPIWNVIFSYTQTITGYYIFRIVVFFLDGDFIYIYIYIYIYITAAKKIITMKNKIIK